MRHKTNQAGKRAIRGLARHARKRASDAIWALGGLTHHLADRIWDLSDWVHQPTWSPFDDNGQLRDDLHSEGWHRVGQPHTDTEGQQ